MKIGIGVISYKRSKECKRVCESILDTLENPHQYQTVCCLDQDDERGYDWVKENFGLVSRANKGIAVNKNRVLKRLKDNDIVFLFEDDLRPIKKGWIGLYLKAMAETDMHHFNHIRLDHRDKLIDVTQFDSCTMCFYEKNTAQLMMFSKKVLEVVGAFDERYGLYGYEHSDYTRRCKNAKLCFPKDHSINHFILESDLYFEEIDEGPVLSEKVMEESKKEAHEIYMEYDPKRIHIPFSKEDY